MPLTPGISGLKAEEGPYCPGPRPWFLWPTKPGMKGHQRWRLLGPVTASRRADGQGRHLRFPWDLV